MGAGASAKYKETSADDVKAAVAGLDDADRVKILEALQAPVSGKSTENKANIKKNKAALHELVSTVLGNKQKLYMERAIIEENRMLILKNFTAAFMGNRQMANQNTDDIFRNRKAIVKSVKAVYAVQLNFAESRINEARIDYMEHRAKMNARVAAGNEKMSEINKLLIEVNNQIMEGNQETVEFNTKHLEINTKLISGDLKLDEATPENNATRIERNTKRIGEITEQAKKNSEAHAKVLDIAKKNSKHIVENAMANQDRRVEIEANHKKIAGNAAKIAAMIGSGSC